MPGSSNSNGGSRNVVKDSKGTSTHGRPPSTQPRATAAIDQSKNVQQRVGSSTKVNTAAGSLPNSGKDAPNSIPTSRSSHENVPIHVGTTCAGNNAPNPPPTSQPNSQNVPIGMKNQGNNTPNPPPTAQPNSQNVPIGMKDQGNNTPNPPPTSQPNSHNVSIGMNHLGNVPNQLPTAQLNSQNVSIGMSYPVHNTMGTAEATSQPSSSYAPMAPTNAAYNTMNNFATMSQPISVNTSTGPYPANYTMNTLAATSQPHSCNAPIGNTYQAQNAMNALAPTTTQSSAYNDHTGFPHAGFYSTSMIPMTSQPNAWYPPNVFTLNQPQGWNTNTLPGIQYYENVRLGLFDLNQIIEAAMKVAENMKKLPEKPTDRSLWACTLMQHEMLIQAVSEALKDVERELKYPRDRSIVPPPLPAMAENVGAFIESLGNRAIHEHKQLLEARRRPWE